jgi:hypothetical protein
MDLARADDVASATADLMAAAAHDLGDYFTFTVQQTDRLADRVPKLSDTH